MSHKSGIILFLALILITFLSIRLATTPSSEKTTTTDTSFSVNRAYSHLQQIARAPHSLGTPENARVRAYIEATCRELGMSVEIQHTTARITRGGTAIAGNVYNIIARIKGQDNSKVVLLTAHYDSQPNAVGAGDDGAGVAAMLETARVLKFSKPLKNDVVFLFTDGEEDGLLGAEGFVQNSPILKEVGVVINFEGRGNSGITNMFETNPGNGWVISMYSRAAAHPHANSLSYEVYKNLPNSTDYTVFKAAGIAGLNNAFIEGAVNYHSMTDKPENLDRNTFQEDGDNMVSLVKYLGDSNIRETKRGDAAYFNVIGTWMVRYPASLNIIILALANLLLVAYVITGVRAGKIRGGGFLWGILIFLVTLVLLFGLNYFLLRVIWAAYPLYDHFYAANSYNVYYYFFAMAALGVTVFSLIYQWALRKFNLSSLLGSILLVAVIATDLLYVVAPTAIYFLCFPLISLLVGHLLIYKKKLYDGERPWATGILNIIFLAPAILLLSPVVYLLFTAFGLSDQSSAVLILLGLFAGLLLPLFAGVFTANRGLIPGVAFACLLIALVMAHLKSGYTEQHPLQTNLRYLVDADKGKAYWTSDFAAKDSWNRQFFTKKEGGRSGAALAKIPKGFHPALINEAPLLDIPVPVLSLQKDTLEDGKRKVWLHCEARAGAIATQILFSDSSPVHRIVVDGKDLPATSNRTAEYSFFSYKGLGKEGFDFMVEVPATSPLDLTLVDRSLGLPVIKGFNMAYPADIIPGPGYNSNTVQVIKHYRF
ncbi:MAG TPA: M20/M25/M40 family metallo-hydrolase [Puia sp.]|nr:M20/M25/M40 family metallo-hydrolase [Puia sp.]